MTVTVRPIGKDSYRWFRIRVAKDGEHETIIRYRPDPVAQFCIQATITRRPLGVSSVWGA